MTSRIDVLEADLLAKIDRVGWDVRKQHEQIVRSVMLAGELLSQVHLMLQEAGKLRHFTAFLSRNGLDRRSAYNYMAAYRAFRRVSVVGRFALFALYSLASPTCPPKALSEAIKLAESGTRVTAKLAKEIIRRHRGQD